MTDVKPMRTRFAPSPTGFLHIGGVRTALFNWLLARQSGGQFILRIDDTDQQRNIEAALQPILDGFRWLGIDWDEGPEVGGRCAPYFQSQRLDRYQAAVNTLLEKGLAYYDFATTEETQAEREEAEREKRDFLYSRKWMAETDDEISRFKAEGRSSVVRLKMHRDGKCEFNDLIRGHVSFDWAKEQDHVIQRADGTCLYHLASVVDDHDFEITHVVRAVEHLANTPRQIFIAQGLGYELPEYAHIPFVAEPGSKTKLSKRKIVQYLKNREFKKLYDTGASIAERTGVKLDPESFNPVLVEFYERSGFLPGAIVNYLLLLGWSLDDKTEDFTRDEMIRDFSLERVVKSPASFDPEKLMSFQERYMNRLSVEEKTDLVIPFLKNSDLKINESDLAVDRVRQIVRCAEDRIKIAGDILKFDDFFVADEALEYDEKAFQKRLVKPENAGHLLSEFVKVLSTLDQSDPDAAACEHLVKSFVDQMGIEIGDIIHALRVALTGKAAGFGMFDTMAILGRQRCLNRIELALAKLHAAQPVADQ
jgi:glutamyl-tRNA synthetase